MIAASAPARTDLDSTLGRISDPGPDGFCSGAPAQAKSDAARGAGGRITMKDMTGCEIVLMSLASPAP